MVLLTLSQFKVFICVESVLEEITHVLNLEKYSHFLWFLLQTWK